MNEHKVFYVVCLLFGASAWGIMWYPYRLLENAGMRGEVSTFTTYLFALIATSIIRPRAWLEFARAPGALTVVALSAGWCNLAYVLGILSGEVMRVLLLFYLAPLWTVPLARLILKENITGTGYLVVFLAFCGAVVMLWNPSFGLPIPSNTSEWLGITSGFTFALANVMVRRLTSCSVVIKTQSVFLGVVVAALFTFLLRQDADIRDFAVIHDVAPLVILVGALLIAMSLAVNYGISHVPATRAIVILLFELVIAALASYFLADEVMEMQEWVGGFMIIAASLFSGQIKEKTPETEKALAPRPGSP